MDFEKKPRQTRWRYIVMGVVFITIILGVALAIGLVYGLRKGEVSNDNLRVISVRSDGFANDLVKLTVEYQAAPQHSLSWGQALQPYRNAAMTSGEREEIIRDGTRTFRNSKSLDLRDTDYVSISIYSGAESAFVRMKIAALKFSSPWSHTFPKRKNSFVSSVSSVPAPISGDLNLTLAVNVESDLPSFSATAFVSALNTSSDPPTVFETFDEISTSLPTTSDAKQLSVSIRHDVVQYGGILTIRLPETTDGVYIYMFEQGISIDILGGRDNEVIPKGLFGLYDIGRKSLFYGDRMPLLCFAMGNPLPDVQLVKQVSDGTDVVLQSDNVLMEHWTKIDALLLTDRTTQTGNYTCRAKQGNKIMEVLTEVIAAEAIQFIEDESRVLENTTTQVVIKCSASGVPVPSVTFRLFQGDGPDMIISGRYPFVRNMTSNTSSLTMTISPVDPGIIDVWCMASQSDADRTSGYPFTLFQDESQRNSTLYQQLKDEQS